MIIMKFKVFLEVPDETIENYKQWILQNNEKNININLNNTNAIELMIKDMLEEQTRWEIESCHLIKE